MRKRRNPIVKPTFAEALDLLAHAEVHARFEPHKSNLCKRSFLNETTIKEHLCKNHNALLKHAWEHSRERSSYGTHGCPKCGKSFLNKARLKRHMVSHRNKTVRCEICSEEFPYGCSLMNNRSHTKSRQFTNSAGRNSPTEEHCKSCEHNAKLTYNDLNLDKFPAGTDRRLSTSTSVPAARRLIGMFTVWMKA
ncbi:zinc finger protein 449 [Culex quinquefasciatus]|uniref:zinc finger protein 449 n=1 Tax=Culex quinquefasciatus TaxID=7176 RepID=UPI0018E2C4E5|nr:zinc finger protein 449 [Culex quinquefasciatus]